MHLCSFHLYAPSDDGEPLTFEQFREHVRSRLPLARVLRRKLARALRPRLPVLDRGRRVRARPSRPSRHAAGAADKRALWDSPPASTRSPRSAPSAVELYLIDGIDEVGGYAPGSIAMLDQDPPTARSTASPGSS